MENLTEARCAVEGCGHPKINHVNNWNGRGPHCMACFTANPWHEFVLAHARPVVEKAEGEVMPLKRCNYMPHTVECGNAAEHKIIETDTGKEFFVCYEHLKNYRDYNERANYEAFTIVK